MERFPELGELLDRLLSSASTLKLQHGTQIAFDKPRAVNSKGRSSRIYDALNASRTADKIIVTLFSGETHSGHLVFNPLKGSVKILDIDSDEPSSIELSIEDVAAIKFV